MNERKGLSEELFFSLNSLSFPLDHNIPRYCLKAYFESDERKHGETFGFHADSPPESGGNIYGPLNFPFKQLQYIQEWKEFQTIPFCFDFFMNLDDSFSTYIF